MKRLLAVVTLLVTAATPAKATEWLICSHGEDTSIRVLLGSADVIAINTIEIEIGTTTWSTKGKGETLINIGQAFETADQLMLDVTDKDSASIFAQLRLFKASETEDYVYGGTLRVRDQGVWAVSCSGP